MDQEDSKMGTENPPEMSSNPPSSGKDDMIGTDNPPELSSNPHSSGKDMMGTENPPEVFSNPLSSEKDDMMGIENAPPAGEDEMIGTENPPEVSSNPLSSRKDGMKVTANPTEVSSNPPLSGKDDMMGADDLPEVTSDRPSSGKDDSKKDTDPPEGSSKPELSDKNTPRSLKAKSKIVKKSQADKLEAKKNNGSQQIRVKKRIMNIKKVVDNAESCHNAYEKQISDNSQLKETNDEPPKGKSQEAENNMVKESQNRSTSDKSPRGKSQQAQKSKKTIQLDKTEQKQKSKEKQRESSKGSRSRKNKDKRIGMEESEKLGGFIFMCNTKTKPDCFRYRVMGVSAGKKDVVLQVKPGLKLFLYDFDLKLLYGIYKASSSGSMKLEPRAFGGKFPAQVRFTIASDCFPLPESIFKKAIKDNYNEKHKFRTELTVKQVRKLTRLFRPVGVHSAGQPFRSLPKTIIRERESPDGLRGSWSHLHRESYNVPSHDRDRQFDQQEEIARDLFLMENNYRVYGLQGERRNVATTSHVNPVLESYERDYEPRHLDPSYLSNVPAHVESLRTDPLYLSDSRHQSYFGGAISDDIKDPYYSYRHGASARDAYLTPLSREEISSGSYSVGGRPFAGTDNLLRRETVQDRRYSIYSAADALPDYNRMQPYQGDKLEASLVPVSSRYSFAGPSFSRR